MDEIVLRAMRKWPDVPRVFGWLRLDRRGNWLVRSPSIQAAPTNGRDIARGMPYERIGNAAVVEFIGRNYEADARGRWFFQNGPQRVFVGLDYTPIVYRLDETGGSLVTQAGKAAGRIERLLLDDRGAVLLRAGPGIGVLDDRDMASLFARLAAENPGCAALDAACEAAGGTEVAGLPPRVALFGQTVRLARIRASQVAAQFGFDPDPAPEPGEPDC